jgi:phosphomannomutase
VGPAYYHRTDQRIKYPIKKENMVRELLGKVPDRIGGQVVEDVVSIDGVKYVLKDDSWLLIRPSGTEPVLRVYAEGRNQEMVESLLKYGEKVAEQLT